MICSICTTYWVILKIEAEREKLECDEKMSVANQIKRQTREDKWTKKSDYPPQTPAPESDSIQLTEWVFVVCGGEEICRVGP